MTKAVLVVLFVGVTAGVSASFFRNMPALRNLLKANHLMPENRWNGPSSFGKRDMPPQEDDSQCLQAFRCPETDFELPGHSIDGFLTVSTDLFRSICAYVNEFRNCLATKTRFLLCSSSPHIEHALGQMERFDYVCTDVGETDIETFLPCFNNKNMQQKLVSLGKETFNGVNYDNCTVIEQYTQAVVTTILPDDCTTSERAAASRILAHFNIFDFFYLFSRCW